MAYICIAWATDLIRTSLPAGYNNLVFHPLSLDWIRSLISANACFLPLPMTGGKPRYFSKGSVDVALSSILISSLVDERVLVLKKIELFSQLIF